MVLYFGVRFAGYSFCVLFFLHFYSETQDTQSADTEPIQAVNFMATNCLFIDIIVFVKNRPVNKNFCTEP